jgi:exonuclease III
MLNTTTNTYTDSSILIFSWNANGLKNHKDELLLTLQDKIIDIALISETHFTNKYFLHLPGFQLYQTNNPDNTAHAGAAIYVRSSLASHPLPEFKTDYIQSCAVSLIVNNIPL